MFQNQVEKGSEKKHDIISKEKNDHIYHLNLSKLLRKIERGYMSHDVCLKLLVYYKLLCLIIQ